MRIVNPEDLNQSDLFYCYSGKLKKYLIEQKNIQYIHKGFNFNDKTEFWIFIRSNKLKAALDEWGENKKNGVRAVE